MTELPWEISCDVVKADLDAGADFLLLDCREKNEHAVAAIAQATLIPMSELTGRVNELAAHRDRRIVVHCHHGGRSLRVAQWLRQQGYQAQSMAGGIDEWSLKIEPRTPRY